MAKRLKGLKIDAVGLVDEGANQHAHITLAKRADVKKDSIDDVENATPSSEGPCPECGGDHPKEGHAAYMASKKDKTTLKAKEAAVDTKDPEQSVEKIADPHIDPIRSDYEKTQDELRKSRDLLEKQLEDARAELEKNRTEVEKIFKQRRRERFIKRVQELDHLPGAPADDFAEFLDDVEKALGEKKFAKFNNLLESWNTVIEKSKLFTEIGRDGSAFGFSGPEGQLDAMAKEAVSSDPDLQKLPAKKAYAKAYQRVIETPEGRAIYKRHLSSRKD